MEKRQKTAKVIAAIREFFYPGISTLGVSPVDGTVQFYLTIDELLPENPIILDYGAGRGEQIDRCSPTKRALIEHRVKNPVRYGCDVDPAVLENPILNEAKLLKEEDDYRIPYPDAHFDVVIADWVVEHLPDPERSFLEIHRVLKRGGWFCLRTPNIYHYSYLIAAAVEGTQWESRLLRIAQPNRQERDVFPKVYRANTKRALKRHLKTAGFSRVVVVPSEPHAAYMNFHPFFALVAGLYHRVALAGLCPRTVLLGFAGKD